MFSACVSGFVSTASWSELAISMSAPTVAIGGKIVLPRVPSTFPRLCLWVPSSALLGHLPEDLPEAWIGGSTGCVWPHVKTQTHEDGRTADHHGLEIAINASEETGQQAACLSSLPDTPCMSTVGNGIEEANCSSL